MRAELSGLDCFKNVSAIENITAGMSSHCYKVTADGKVFFTKTLSNPNEVLLAKSAAKLGISPEVIFANQHWLVTRFIGGENLTASTKSLDEKIDVSIQLMAKCHQLTTNIPKMSAVVIIKDLVNQADLSYLQQQQLNDISEQVSARLLANHNLVCCHGDMNFTNVLVDSQQAAWLLDFECAYQASAEFDLAMFVAINNLNLSRLPEIITGYQKANSLIDINAKLVENYLAFSYLINGLWYFGQSKEYQPSLGEKRDNQAIFKKLARQQWQQFDDLVLPFRTNQPLASIIESL